MLGGDLYTELQASARSVLRGSEPQGMLARVADVRTRRRLAAEFMHRDASTQLEVDWTDRLEEALRGKLERSCGKRAGGEGRRKAAIPDDFEPVCWYSWIRARDVSDEVARMRRQAARNFPMPFFQALWTAHSDEPQSRVLAAWEVLDAVDRGGKVVGPLAKFLRVSRKAIKLSAKCALLKPNEWVYYGRTRRTLRVLQAMWAIGPEIQHRYSVFPEVDVVARTTGLSILTACMRVDGDRYGLPGEALSAKALLAIARTIRRHKHMKSRAVQPAALKAVLPCGWKVRSLESQKALRGESLAMGHCLMSHAARVLTGEEQAIALRSGDGQWRATAVIEPPLRASEDVDYTSVQIAGPRNEPFHPAVLVAVGEFLILHGRKELRVGFL